MPRNSLGLVYWGGSRSPEEKLSPKVDSLLPKKPGTSLATASMTAMAGISPPLRT
jgi:hypothetical protein